MTLTLSALLILGLIIIYVVLIAIFSFLFRITGLNNEKSLFQAISLLTTCGFTTRESEVIAGNRTRRRLAVAAMITGYAFSVIIVSLIINFMMNLSSSQVEDSFYAVLIIFLSFVALLVIFYIPAINRRIDQLTGKLAVRIMKRKQKNNVITILEDYGKDCICEVLINQMPDLLKDKTVFESKLKSNYQLNIVLINRKGRIVDVKKDTMFNVGDVIVVFGSSQNIKDIFTISKKEMKEILEREAEFVDNTVSLIDNYQNSAMAEITINRIPEILDGKKLFETGLKSKYGINVAFIEREDKHIEVTKDTIILLGDILMVFGPYKNIKEVFLYSDR